MAWETQKVEMLRKLNEQSFSASQIAAQLGDGITRNAVIGKLHRMGLSCGGGKQTARVAPEKKKQDARPMAKGAAPQPVVVPQLNPSSEKISVLDLSDTICRFPFGDPNDEDFRFCGANKGFDALPYCDYHMQLVHQRSRRQVKTPGRIAIGGMVQQKKKAAS